MSTNMSTSMSVISQTFLRIVSKYYEETTNGFVDKISSINEFTIPYDEYEDTETNIFYSNASKESIEKIIWDEYNKVFNHLPSYGLYGSDAHAVELVIQIGSDDEVKGIMRLKGSCTLPKNIFYKPEPIEDSLEYCYETFINNICGIDEEFISSTHVDRVLDLNKFLLDE